MYEKSEFFVNLFLLFLLKYLFKYELKNCHPKHNSFYVSSFGSSPISSTVIKKFLGFTIAQIVTKIVAHSDNNHVFLELFALKWFIPLSSLSFFSINRTYGKLCNRTFRKWWLIWVLLFEGRPVLCFIHFICYTEV